MHAPQLGGSQARCGCRGSPICCPLLPAGQPRQTSWQAHTLSASLLPACAYLALPLVHPCRCSLPRQALHCEENNFAALPVAPYLTNLRELLVDWRTLLASPGFLGSATQLSRLVLQRFQSLVPPVPGGGAGFITHPLGAGEALLAALAAMPSLQRVDDVYEAGNQTHWVTGDMAHVMWQLGRRCPHLQLGQPRSTNLGWTLSTLVAELPHNAGGTTLMGE